MDNFVEILIMPIRRVIVMLFSLEVGSTTLGSLILIGILFSVLIAIITHAHGSDFGGFISKIRGKGKNE